jgi:hypothetical protein
MGVLERLGIGMVMAGGAFNFAMMLCMGWGWLAP